MLRLQIDFKRKFKDIDLRSSKHLKETRWRTQWFARDFLRWQDCVLWENCSLLSSSEWLRRRKGQKKDGHVWTITEIWSAGIGHPQVPIANAKGSWLVCECDAWLNCTHGTPNIQHYIQLNLLSKTECKWRSNLESSVFLPCLSISV